jgi:hypothetical protein
VAAINPAPVHRARSAIMAVEARAPMRVTKEPKCGDPRAGTYNGS